MLLTRTFFGLVQRWPIAVRLGQRQVETRVDRSFKKNKNKSETKRNFAGVDFLIKLVEMKTPARSGSHHENSVKLGKTR